MKKFRAEEFYTREKIYGGYCESEGNGYIVRNFQFTLIDKDTLAQFCGLDSNGDEVYEGDTVTAHGKSYKVELKPKYGLFNNLEKAILQSESGNCRR